MEVGFKKTQHQQYVEEVFNAMDEEARNELIKSFILCNVTPTKDGRLQITKAIQDASNRVKILNDVESVAIALSIAARWWNYAITKEKGFDVIFEDDETYCGECAEET